MLGIIHFQCDSQQTSNSIAFCRRDENTWMELLLKLFISNVIFYKSLNAVQFLEVMEHSWTELSLEASLSNVVFYKSWTVGHVVQLIQIVEQNCNLNHRFVIWFLYISNCMTFCRSDENSRTELYLESFISTVISYKWPIAGYSLEQMKTVERHSYSNHLSLMWFSTNLHLYSILLNWWKQLHRTLFIIIYF